MFQERIDKILALPDSSRQSLKNHLINANKGLLETFLKELERTLDRQIEAIVLIPLHGMQDEFRSVDEAISFVERYEQSGEVVSGFRKYEAIVRYTNGDKIDASFADKRQAVAFLRYVEGG